MNAIRLIALGGALLIFAGCGPSQKQIEANAEAAAEDEAADAAADLQASNYEDVAGTDDCTEDCSGHDAGFEYATEHDITNPDDCDGNNDSFVEGCQAYGEEIQRRADDAAAAVENGEDPDEQ